MISSFRYLDEWRPADLSANDERTTFVVQTSLTRVWLLDETCTRWKDPIGTVVVLTDKKVTTRTLQRHL
jgi:hypothetical protein